VKFLKGEKGERASFPFFFGEKLFTTQKLLLSSQKTLDNFQSVDKIKV
jgi:hypothetical protein